jgi:hypothetical protein
MKFFEISSFVHKIYYNCKLINTSTTSTLTFSAKLCAGDTTVEEPNILLDTSYLMSTRSCSGGVQSTQDTGSTAKQELFRSNYCKNTVKKLEIIANGNVRHSHFSQR